MARGIVAILPLAALFSPKLAYAFDGITLFSAANGTGDALPLTISDDTTAPMYNSYGTTGVRLPDSGSLTNRAMSIQMVANLSDVQLYVFQSDLRHADNAFDSSSDLGGDGSHFMGGKQGYRCPKGHTCMYNLNGFANKNRALIVQREFYSTNLNFGAFYIPFTSNKFGLNSDGTIRMGITDIAKTAIDGQIISSPQVESVTDEHTSSSWEPAEAMCTRENLTTGICANDFAREYTDLIRLHWDSQLTPVQNSTCSAVAGIVGILSGGFLWGVGDAICNSITGSYRVTADVWVQPYEGTKNNFYQFGMSEVFARYSANPYSGAGASTVVSQIRSSFEGSQPAVLLRNGFDMKVGQVICANHSAANWAANCTSDGVNEDDNIGGVHFFQANRPARMQLGLDIDTGTSNAVANYFSPSNDLASDAHTGLLDVEFSR